MGKKIISSEEFIDRFVECLEKGKEFRLENCIVEGDVNILDIYERIKEKIKDEEKLKKLIEERDEGLLKKVIINIKHTYL
jgi:exonuclease III